MKIEHYITQLLYRYQYVAVPGFGAFLTEIQSAQLVESSNYFYPPKKLVSFNSNLKSNDGLLANHISQSEHISYETAVQNINSEVALWKNSLQKNETIILKNIGTIKLNVEQNLIFESSNGVNYLTDAFGLNAFVAPFVKRNQSQIVQNIDVFEDKSLVNLTPSRFYNNSYLKYAAVFLVGLGTAGYFGNNYYQDKINSENQVVHNEVLKEVQNKIQEATFFIKTPLPNVSLLVKEKAMSYHVVAGAFRNEKNAQRTFEKLKLKGYKSRRVEKNRFGLFPVLYGSYTTYNEAQKAMIEIHKTESKEAWLMIKDL